MNDLDVVVERRATRIANDLLLPEETRKIRAEARRFAADVIRPVAHELNCTPEARDGFRFDLFKAIADAGLYRVPYPTDVGGLGLEYPMLATLTVIEELGYYSPGLASAMYDGQAILVGKSLDNAGGAARTKWLPGIVRGEYVASFATSEPEASTDLSAKSLRTTAERTANGWIINGRKRWITNSVAASRVLLLCRTGTATTTFFVDMNDPGVTVSDPDLKMGNHPQLTADITFRDVFVSDEDMIGEEGKGLRTALGALALGRMGIGAIGCALAQRAIDLSAAYITTRTVFGQAIASFQHWQFTFAEHAIELEAARSLYQKAALCSDKGLDTEPWAAMCKVKGSSLAVDVARDAIQACGGYGFARETRGDGTAWQLEAIYRDAKIGEIYEGANEVQKWLIARYIFGRNITG